jgi:dephospho-CoA kinase
MLSFASGVYKRMKIGLTGGIASGKSTVARYLQQLGAHVIDADRLGHQVYQPNTPGFTSVVAAFGPEVLGPDGEIDRRALGARVFGAPEQLKRLTDIVWPQIRVLAEAEMAAVTADDPNRIIVLEAAVLLEAGWETAVDEVWAVVVEPGVAIERACARDGLAPEAVQQRIDAQMSNEQRTGRAHVVIDNSNNQEVLLARVDREWLRIIGNDGRAAQRGAA